MMNRYHFNNISEHLCELIIQITSPRTGSLWMLMNGNSSLSSFSCFSVFLVGKISEFTASLGKVPRLEYVVRQMVQDSIRNRRSRLKWFLWTPREFWLLQRLVTVIIPISCQRKTLFWKQWDTPYLQYPYLSPFLEPQVPYQLFGSWAGS